MKTEKIKSETVDIAFQKSGERRTSSSRRAERELTALKLTEQNAAPVALIRRILLLWAALMLENSPGFMGRLFTAVGDEWTQHSRGVLYDWDENPQEQTCRSFIGLIHCLQTQALKPDNDITWVTKYTDEVEPLRARAAAMLGLSEPLGTFSEVSTLPPSAELIALKEKLTKLESLPENEAIAFQLESEIYRLEGEAARANEWPDVIGGAR